MYLPIEFLKKSIEFLAHMFLFFDHAILRGLGHFEPVLDSVQLTNSLIFLSLWKTKPVLIKTIRFFFSIQFVKIIN